MPMGVGNHKDEERYGSESIVDPQCISDLMEPDLISQLKQIRNTESKHANFNVHVHNVQNVAKKLIS